MKKYLKLLLCPGISCGSIAGFLLLASSAVHAQELSLFGGASQGTGLNTYSWAINYQENLGPNFAASLMWLNEGHIPEHHRDGQAMQFWARLPLDQRRWVLSAGVGPYRYYDTYTGQKSSIIPMSTVGG